MTEPEREPDTADLRKAYHALQERGSDGCPPPETLAALATGELAGEERDRASDHVVRCRSCSEATQILIQTHAEADRQSRAGGARLIRYAGFAAAAAVAVLAVRLFMAPRPEPSVERGPSNPARVVPPDGASLPGAPDQFAWPAESDADSYRLKLFDDTGEPLWQSDSTHEARAAFPPSERARLKAGKAFFWNVEVEGRLGKRRLGPFRFRLSQG
jgi:hypothetical protein